MTKKSLVVLSADTGLTKDDQYISERLARKNALQAKFERLWLINPDQFNPLRNVLQEERLERTWHLINQYVQLKDKKCTDIGCAAGVFSRRLRDAGASVIAVDIAENALKHLRKHDMHHIEAKQDSMPTTTLSDNAFDLVVCMEIIAYLDRKDFRLFFSELARIVKPEGCIVCSTAIDIYTEEGLQRFLQLAESELKIVDYVLSYHALYLRLKSLLDCPSIYLKGWKDSACYEEELRRRPFLSRLWFSLNASFLLAPLWTLINWLTQPLRYSLKHHLFWLIQCEKLCQLLWNERGVSHISLLAQRRPLNVNAPYPPPLERPKKREVWE